jgi:hypothetical protein
MAKELRPIDISNAPDLLRIAEEVRNSGEPRVLRRDSEDLAVLSPVVPIAKRRGRRTPSKADWEAFRASAGGWSDVDTDKLVEDIYESRRRSVRPPVEL